MLYPSVDTLKKEIDSKYSLVSLASKRARQMQEEQGTERLHKYVSHKSVGKALEEVAAGVLTKVSQDESTVYEDEI
ncbi:DNA-directed RNA polymerase subunit omega [Lysinibacillus xylanilyticus]|uniref:DNA-directed RNA polymerase subunit omega n=1 Tax=Lysinibacillus xylanilyticus TaxID=582475 RepID=A0A0K9F5P8_9BACI|nr:DNA-directed RNA polymerase subunit omega [Lysinibacillus xylanilyticus]KMY29483.1 DNA-directed RNA polymerase subunit omega [Lysinibacillus xylanilyticus]MCY9545848.1 DNA-directed RNA polymerase subunit omega [Lysinibacillus xylanilyticus]MED3801941.1 DNA-directed RNA polymerase subunit omega [Lysinibacillus xylanilyticus]